MPRQLGYGTPGRGSAGLLLPGPSGWGGRGTAAGPRGDADPGDDLAGRRQVGADGGLGARRFPLRTALPAAVHDEAALPGGTGAARRPFAEPRPRVAHGAVGADREAAAGG